MLKSRRGAGVESQEEPDDVEGVTQIQDKESLAGPTTLVAVLRVSLQPSQHGSKHSAAFAADSGDPLTHRLEVADAEEDGRLQASLDQPAAIAAGMDEEAAAPARVPAEAAARPRNAGANKQRGRRSSGGPGSSRLSVADSAQEGPRAELCPAIPPDSDATPAGVPQPTLRGRPIAPTNNTESSSGPPPDSAQAHQPHDHPSEAQADQVRSIQPVQLPAGHEQPTIKDDAGPSLDDFDFGGLAGMNVFKKRGGAASAAGLSGDAEAAGGRITTQSQPSGSRQMGRTDVAVSAAGSTLNLSRPVAMQQRIGTKMAAPAAAKGSQDAVMQDLSTEDQQPDGISAAAVADDSKQQDSDPPAGVATKVEQPDSNDGDPDPGAAKMAATADQADCINARVLSSSGMDSGGAAGLDAAADSQQRTAGSNHQLLETAAKPSPAEVGNDAKANPEGVFAEEAGMEPQQREGARGTAQGPSGVSGSSALNQNAQVPIKLHLWMDSWTCILCNGAGMKGRLSHPDMVQYRVSLHNFQLGSRRSPSSFMRT